jgi:glutaredoxin 3
MGLRGAVAGFRSGAWLVSMPVNGLAASLFAAARECEVRADRLAALRERPRACYVLHAMPPITIYTKSWCPYCSAAKDLLKKKGAAFDEVEIEGQAEKRTEMIARSGGRSTVPQIFIGERHVGGCDDLYALDRGGELDRLLSA